MIRADMRGLNALNRRLTSMAKEEATKAGQSANRAGAAVLAKAVKQAAPTSTRTTEGETRTRHNKGGTTRQETHGKIINHVKVKKLKSTDPTQVKNGVVIGPKAYHASFVQFGSIHNAADPFMLRAFEDSQQSIIEAISKMLERQLVKRGM